MGTATTYYRRLRRPRSRELKPRTGLLNPRYSCHTTTPSMQSTESLDYRIHQMQLGSPRSPLNCQVLSLHLPHPNLQPSRNTSHLPPPMSAQSRSQGSLYYQKPENVPTYLSSPSLVSSSRPDERSLPTYQSRSTAVQRSYDLPGDGSRDSKAALRLSTGTTISQHDEPGDELSGVGMHLSMGSPGVARRAKAHVPSACVNCKRKHLACETRRPCNRCLQAGKEVGDIETTTPSNAC